MLRALHVCASWLRFSGRSRQEYTPHTTASLLAADQGGIELATARLRKQAREPRENFQRPFREYKTRAEGSPRLTRTTARARRHARSPQRVHPRTAKTQKKTSSFCTWTPIPAEGRAPQESQKNKFLYLDHADPAEGRAGTARIAKKRVFLRRPRRSPQGSSEHRKKCTSTTPIPADRKTRKKPRVSAPRPRRSPQKVARALLHLDRAEGRTGTARIAKNRVFLRRPRRSPQGSSEHRKNAKNLEFLHLDHADPRRGSRGHRKNRKKPRVSAPRPRRSPQRAPQESQKILSFCTSTTPMPAEGRNPDRRSKSCPGALACKSFTSC